MILLDTHVWLWLNSAVEKIPREVLVWRREIDPGKVFDLRLPLEQVAEGYRAMDERRAIKALLIP